MGNKLFSVFYILHHVLYYCRNFNSFDHFYQVCITIGATNEKKTSIRPKSFHQQYLYWCNWTNYWNGEKKLTVNDASLRNKKNSFWIFAHERIRKQSSVKSSGSINFNKIQKSSIILLKFVVACGSNPKRKRKRKIKTIKIRFRLRSSWRNRLNQLVKFPQSLEHV